jgi:hypothetical protein
MQSIGSGAALYRGEEPYLLIPRRAAEVGCGQSRERHVICQPVLQVLEREGKGDGRGGNGELGWGRSPCRSAVGVLRELRELWGPRNPQRGCLVMLA